ncbi:MAG: hypothetical protein WD449_00490 [Candidatus Babeliales bacterium]
MAVTHHIKKVKEGLRRGVYASEAAVSQGILLPALHELGWPIFDTDVVTPEFSVEGRRVDYALCHPANKPSVFIEVKKVGQQVNADRQLFEYAFHLGVPMAILTDGQEWSFYLPGEQGHYYERRVYKLDLLERDISEAVNRFERYLRYNSVCTGESLQAARKDYQHVSRDREIEASLPKAWNTLLKEPDSLLIDLLAEKVEDLCGYKPDLDLCVQFLNRSLKQEQITPTPSFDGRNSHPKPKKTNSQKVDQSLNGNKFNFSFKGESHQARSARDMLVKVFKLLAEADADFLRRFVSRKHGKKRRYLAQDKKELYPGRHDLAEEHSVEIIPGWWIGTNYSRSNIQQILELALEVVDSRIRSELLFNDK